MTATGWYNVVTLGARNGNFNPDFSDSSGNPLGDPYGSMGMMAVVVPNGISNGTSLPAIEILIQGMQLATFDSNGNPLGNSFTNNPAWVCSISPEKRVDDDCWTWPASPRSLNVAMPWSTRRI